MIKTDGVVQLQKQQSTYRDMMYDAHARDNKEEIVKYRNEYDNTVRLLQEMLGNSAPCWEVDCDLWNFFSDYHKDVNGFRPKSPRSRKDVLEWIEFQDRIHCQNAFSLLDY